MKTGLKLCPQYTQDFEEIWSSDLISDLHNTFWNVTDMPSKQIFWWFQKWDKIVAYNSPQVSKKSDLVT